MNQALVLGGRQLLAMSCWRCGKLLPPNRFGYHLRNLRDKRAYVDRRCVDCKWSYRVKGKSNAYESADRAQSGL